MQQVKLEQEALAPALEAAVRAQRAEDVLKALAAAQPLESADALRDKLAPALALVLTLEAFADDAAVSCEVLGAMQSLGRGARGELHLRTLSACGVARALKRCLVRARERTESARLELAMSALQVLGSDEEVTSSACAVVATVTITFELRNERIAAVPLVVSALQAHGCASLDLATRTMAATRKVVGYGDLFIEQLAFNAGILTAVERVLHTHAAHSAAVACDGLHVLESITFFVFTRGDWIHCACASGVPQAVVVALRVHFRMSLVALNGCMVLSRLVYPDCGVDICDWLFHAHAAELLIRVVERHYHTDLVTEHACAALGNLLTIRSDETLERLRYSGAARVLSEALRKHSGTPFVAEQVCRVLSSLALNADLRRQLLRENALSIAQECKYNAWLSLATRRLS